MQQGSIRKYLALGPISLAVMCCLASTAEAATVKKINKKKKTVVIDEGKDSGIEKGAKICFKDDEGTELGCGKVTAIKKAMALVKVNAKTLKGLKKGMTAEASSTESSGETTTAGTEETGKAGSTTAKGAGSKYRRNIKLAYIMTPMSVASMERLSYAYPPKDASGNNQPAESLWSSAGKTNQSLLGFGVEAEFGIGTSMSFALGVRQKMYSDFSVEADYHPTDKSQYAQTTQTYKAMGAWFDFYYLEIPLGTSFFFRLGNGLDIDMSTATLDVVHKYDGTGASGTDASEFEIATATSKLTTLSLRTMLNATYFLDPMGFNLALNLLLPVSASATFSGEVSDQSAAGAVSSGDAADDLKKMLNHTKQSFGAEIVLSTFFAF